MLMRMDLDRMAQQFFAGTQAATWSRPASIPLDAYRDGDQFVVAFDLPGVSADAIDINVERSVLTVKAERRPLPLSAQAQTQVSERPLGAFARQVFLSDALQTDNIHASYADGVLVLRIPVAEQAKPRKVEINSGQTLQAINA